MWNEYVYVYMYHTLLYDYLHIYSLCIYAHIPHVTTLTISYQFLRVKISNTFQRLKLYTRVALKTFLLKYLNIRTVDLFLTFIISYFFILLCL